MDRTFFNRRLHKTEQQDTRLLISAWNKPDWKIKSTLSSHAVVSCRCYLITLYAVVLHLVTTAHKFDSRFVINWTPQEIFSIIRSIQTKNSSSYDEISTKLLKISANHTCSPLIYICNTSVLTGIFPDRLKYSTIKPLHKKGDITDPSNIFADIILKSYRKSHVKYNRLTE
jgi:hypothetical protein